MIDDDDDANQQQISIADDSTRLAGVADRRSWSELGWVAQNEVTAESVYSSD
ncbi:MAG: hypothetical protein IV107_24930 [Paucibacter sp.]|nr:hypothetical protein [Roseateles sp.]